MLGSGTRIRWAHSPRRSQSSHDSVRWGYVIQRADPPAIRADALQFATDLASNVAIPTVLSLAGSGLHGLDPIFGSAIGTHVYYSAIRIGREAVDPLLDRELPESQRAAIIDLARSVPMVRTVHELGGHALSSGNFSGDEAQPTFALDLEGDGLPGLHCA